MFNTKLLLALARIVGILLILKALLVLGIFIWSLFGTMPNPLFDQKTTQVLNILQELGTTALVYIFVGVIGKIAMHKGEKAMAAAPKAAAPRRAAPAQKPAKRK